MYVAYFPFHSLRLPFAPPIAGSLLACAASFRHNERHYPWNVKFIGFAGDTEMASTCQTWEAGRAVPQHDVQ